MNDKNKRTHHVQDEIGNVIHQNEQSFSACGKGGIGMTPKVDGLTLSQLCAKARREEVQYIRHQKMYTRVPRVTCMRETGKARTHQDRMGGDKGQLRKLNVHARCVAKE